jgi:hypothetical protein
MKTLKIMSIIGIVYLSLCFVFIVILTSQNSDSGAAGWGILALLYAIPYSIVGLVQASKLSKDVRDVSTELLKLNELKEKAILTEEEFNSRKARILNI